MGWFDTIGKVVVAGLVLVGIVALIQPALLDGITGGESTIAVSGSGEPTAVSGPTPRPTATQSDTVAGDVAGEGGSAAGLSRERIETLTHREVNDRRARENLSPIPRDENLQTIARGHSSEMAMQSYFAHESPSGQTFEGRYENAGYYCRVEVGDGYLTGAENIYKIELQGRTVGNGQIAEAAVDSWMNSPEHRRNLLRPQWDDMGLGVYILESGSGTTIYITQNFC